MEAQDHHGALLRAQEPLVDAWDLDGAQLLVDVPDLAGTPLRAPERLKGPWISAAHSCP